MDVSLDETQLCIPSNCLNSSLQNYIFSYLKKIYLNLVNKYKFLFFCENNYLLNITRMSRSVGEQVTWGRGWRGISPSPISCTIGSLLQKVQEMKALKSSNTTFPSFSNHIFIPYIAELSSSPPEGLLLSKTVSELSKVNHNHTQR